MTDPVPPELALAAVLARALLAAEQLRDALAAASAHAEAVASLSRPGLLAEPGATRDARMCPHTAFSPREVEVLTMVARGRSNQEIARTLCLSPRTVQRHVANAYLKIGAHNRAEATAYALNHGLR